MSSSILKDNNNNSYKYKWLNVCVHLIHVPLSIQWTTKNKHMNRYIDSILHSKNEKNQSGVWLLIEMTDEWVFEDKEYSENTNISLKT